MYLCVIFYDMCKFNAVILTPLNKLNTAINNYVKESVVSIFPVDPEYIITPPTRKT